MRHVHPPANAASALRQLLRARRHAGLPDLEDSKEADLDRHLHKIIEIARISRGVAAPAKWQRERVAQKIISELRAGRVSILDTEDASLVLMELGFLDDGMDRATWAWRSEAEERAWRADPDRAAREVLVALQHQRDTGYLGRKIGVSGQRERNRSGRQRDLARAELIAESIAIFEEFTASKATCSTDSPASAFASDLLAAAGYPTTGLRHAMAEVLTILRNDDSEIDARMDRE